MEKPLVTICLLTYMHRKYIADCLASLINQTYSNIELLILDDASTDSTMEIINSYEQAMKERFVRVEIKHNEVNSGNISANLNVLIRQAQGQYIKTFAGDDIMLPELIEETVAYMEQNKHFIMCHTNAYIVNDRYRLGSKLYGETWSERHKIRIHGDIFRELLQENYICAPAALIRRRAYDEYGLYDENIRAEDYEFWLRLSGGENFAYLDRLLVCYRVGKTSVTNYRSRDGEKKFVSIMRDDKKAVQKHIGRLPLKDRQEYRRFFFNKRLVWAIEAGLWNTALQLIAFMWRRGYNIDRDDVWKTFQRKRVNTI